MQLRNGKQILSVIDSAKMVSTVNNQFVSSVAEAVFDAAIKQKTINDCITRILKNKITAFSEVQSKLCIGDVERLNEEIRLLSEMYYIIEEYDLRHNPQFTTFIYMIFIKSPEFYNDIMIRITPENNKYKTMRIADRKAAEKMLITLRKYM